MQKPGSVILLVLLLAVSFDTCRAGGKLEGPVTIHSSILGYDLQYWIYLPENKGKELPELYVTDGQAYLTAGKMVEILDREIENGNIVPIAAVFVDSRNLDYPTETRRNQQFMCNADYGKFFVGELMPEISSRWTGADASTRRGLMGVSFGGINSACFGIMMPGVFQLLVMHSPGSDKHLDVVNDVYKERPLHSSAIFISHGGEADNSAAAQRFVQTLEEKGYPVRHVSNNGGHDWDNWRPLIDDSLRAFAGTHEEDEIRQPPNTHHE